jgi:hypothetical protein
MKRALILLGAAGIVALLAFLIVTRHLSGERAARLDRALMESENRVVQLEGELQTLKQQLEQLSKSPDASGASTAASSTPAGGAMVSYTTATGSAVTNIIRIEGTSSVHDWRVQGPIIGGTVQLPTGFPPTEGKQQPAGPLPVTASVFIPVRSLKSLQANGRPYSDAMDEIMYGKLLAQSSPRIFFTLTTLNAKQEVAAGSPAVCEASGNLVVAGKTNAITMPVTVASGAEGRIQFSGSVKTKMTDFGIQPPEPSLGAVSIKTGNEVTLRFTWWVKPVAPSAPGK